MVRAAAKSTISPELSDGAPIGVQLELLQMNTPLLANDPFGLNVFAATKVVRSPLDGSRAHNTFVTRSVPFAGGWMGAGRATHAFDTSS